MITVPRQVPTCCEHHESAPPTCHKIHPPVQNLRCPVLKIGESKRRSGGAGQRTCAVPLVPSACHLHNTTLPENISLQSRCHLAVSTGRSVGRPGAAHRHKLSVVIQIHRFTTHETQDGQHDTVKKINLTAATTAQYSDP
jgi:hypothetical protein